MPALFGFQQLSVFTSSGLNLVRDLDVLVQPGEVLGVIGESGSGKTLSFQAGLGVLPTGVHAKGQLIWENQAYDLTGNVPFNHWRGKRVGYMWQEPLSALNPVSTVGAQVQEAILQAPSKEKCLELFQQVRLNNPESVYQAYPHEISGGQRQRALLAMALANHPDLLIADEPTSGLDEELQSELIHLFKDLVKARPAMALILISHDLNWTRKLAHRLLVMQEGRAVEDCGIEDLDSEERHAFTKSLLRAQPLEPRNWNRLPWSGYEGMKKEAIHDIDKTRTSTAPVLEVKGLTIGYKNKVVWKSGYKPVVEEVSFSLHKGECIGIQGPSGVGKSSLARALVRLIPAQRGKVIVNGIDWLPLNEILLRPLRRQMQFIFQDPVTALNPRLTIFEQLKDLLQLRGIKLHVEQEQAASELLSRVGMESSKAFSKYPHEFSGGQRQRIAIARALAAAPDVLICDEAIAALDRNTQAQVLNLLADLRDQGLCLVFIAHERYAVEFLSDKIAHMHQGRLEWV